MEVECEAMQITYCKVSDPKIDSAIEEKIDTFASSITKDMKTSLRSLVVTFYQMPRPKGLLEYFTKTEKEYWERWVIQLQLVPKDLKWCTGSGDDVAKLEANVLRQMTKIIEFTDVAIRNNHVPSLDQKPGQFEISFDNQYATWSTSLMDWLKAGNIT
jgi:hypothetical protein